MGASKTYIVNVVLRETALVTVAGIIVGIVFTEGLKVLLGYRFPTLPFPITSDWRVRAAVIAFVGSLLGAIYPAWKAARKDPIDALAYE
jgi:putative ABC transport system permease protein